MYWGVLCEENEGRGSCTDPLSFNSQLRHSQALSTSYLAELLAAGLALGKCHAAHCVARCIRYQVKHLLRWEAGEG